MRVIPVIPRAGADKYAICKPLRTPIAYGSATERIVRIVAVRAYRRRVVITIVRPDLYPDRNLSL
jgi:hypothetical protein